MIGSNIQTPLHTDYNLNREINIKTKKISDVNCDTAVKRYISIFITIMLKSVSCVIRKHITLCNVVVLGGYYRDTVTWKVVATSTTSENARQAENGE